MYLSKFIFNFMKKIKENVLFPIDDAFEIVSRIPGFAKDMPKNARFNLKKLAKDRKHVSDDKMAKLLISMRWEEAEPARKSMWRPVADRDWNVQLIYFNEVEQEYGTVRAQTALEAKEIVIAQHCQTDETFEVMGKIRNKSDWMRCQLVATEIK